MHTFSHNLLVMGVVEMEVLMIAVLTPQKNSHGMYTQHPPLIVTCGLKSLYRPEVDGG
jgi:hypothetical protein